MRSNSKYIFCSLLLSSFAWCFSACSDWTDVESITLQEPSIESQNPELYAKYLESLKAYKQSSHLVTIVSMNNVASMPSNRSQHLTDIPDSVDYICLNNLLAVNEINAEEMVEVRKKGTKVMGLVDFDAIESAWEAVLEAEKNTDSDEGETETVDEATRFINYCKEEVNKQLSAANALAVDGIEANFTGYDLNSLVGEEAIAAETARQGAFFDVIADWHRGAGKEIIFKGTPQNVINKNLLADYAYIIVNAHTAKDSNKMSYLIEMASVDGVPADRFVMGVSTPFVDATGDEFGAFTDGSSSIVGAARWSVANSTTYAAAGISVDNVETDYFNNVSNVYPSVKEAIRIMNPNR